MSLRHFSTPLAASVLTMLAVGCASAPPPPELLDARSAYIRAESGPAAQLKPDSLHEAKVALDKAERAYSDDPKEQKTRDATWAKTNGVISEIRDWTFPTGALNTHMFIR